MTWVAGSIFGACVDRKYRALVGVRFLGVGNPIIIGIEVRRVDGAVVISVVGVFPIADPFRIAYTVTVGILI